MGMFDIIVPLPLQNLPQPMSSTAAGAYSGMSANPRSECPNLVQSVERRSAVMRGRHDSVVRVRYQATVSATAVESGVPIEPNMVRNFVVSRTNG